LSFRRPRPENTAFDGVFGAYCGGFCGGRLDGTPRDCETPARNAKHKSHPMLSSCPHCSHELDEAELKQYSRRRNAKRRWGRRGTERCARRVPSEITVQKPDFENGRRRPHGFHASGAHTSRKIRWWLDHDRRRHAWVHFAHAPESRAHTNLRNRRMRHLGRALPEWCARRKVARYTRTVASIVHLMAPLRWRKTGSESEETQKKETRLETTSSPDHWQDYR
jgi:hypothetical protein